MRNLACGLVFLLAAGCGAEMDGRDGADGDTMSPEGWWGGGAMRPGQVDCVHEGSGKDYQVGPGKAYANIGDVPLETLVAGDTVRVFHRATPYREKVMLSGQGTAEQPIRFCGVPGAGGELPVIDGQDATTRPQLDFPYNGHQVRGLVIVGHQHGDQNYYRQPRHITIEGFEIRNADPSFTFEDKSGQVVSYSHIAAGIFVERGDHVTIRGCHIHDNNNGIFMGTSGDAQTVCKDALVEANDIHDNGDPSEYYEHNVYNEVQNIVYQFNRFGPTRNLNGNAIKERSAGVIIRYNWIDDGAHVLDLVDAQEAKSVNVALPSFHETFVYGNILFRGTENVGTIVHYGGDSGLYQNYRKGTLHFYANTVVVDNSESQDYDIIGMFEASTNDEHLDVRNNVFFSVDPASNLREVNLLGARDNVASGVLTMQNNWITEGWTVFDSTPQTSTQKKGSATGFEASKFGTDPGFTSLAAQELAPSSSSPLVGAGASLDDLAVVDFVYEKHYWAEPRKDDASTIGAFVP